MRGIYLKSLLAAAIVILGCAVAQAETLIPRAIEYDTEVKDDPSAKTCNVVLSLLNLPAPEAINFHFIVAQEKSSGLTFVGFSLDVGDLTFKNGIVAGTNKAVLASGAFISPSFSSVGRLNGGPIPDGGVLESTSDPQVYSSFLTAFLSGNFQIRFERDGIPGARTYAVSQKPPANVISRFTACVSSLKQ